MHRIGLDIGSTTIKTVVLDETGHVCHTQYERHFSRIAEKAREVLLALGKKFPGKHRLCISGSAGIGLSEQLGIPFAQEVFATRTGVTTLRPDADVVIELGGRRCQDPLSDRRHGFLHERLLRRRDRRLH
ncbi:hypothetical protein [Faecalibaculum rodentium]|uniref:2-hydroxyglutaryl-CoA dehydratase D-component-like protein n=1 Tax=Faecalibaculum rodentium TaxID=1702221 RepID=A0A140DWL5_9FIRM|nr:hypothetical protein [Faecalibaculum rodentium]AMK55042.1 2-hydroxyglutaryl-CoA dehydratase D-component-like protein [Faecalibaculum rodentium]